MNGAEVVPNEIRRFYRTDIHKCPECRRTVKKARTISSKRVVTLSGVIKMTHAGYCCRNPACPAQGRVYRSVAADALVLPCKRFGLDIILLIGHLRLGKHQRVDEIHEEISRRLQEVSACMSRREVLYLFDDFCTLMRAASDAELDDEWKRQVEKNGGILVSIDGIQPEKGNEMVYIVRDALTGRVIAAENTETSSAERIKQILGPVKQLGLKVLGTISDAQEAEVKALKELWPDAPHQMCHFHALKDAGERAFEEDCRVKKEIRGGMQTPLRTLRKQIKEERDKATGAKGEQLALLEEYTDDIQAAVNLGGTAPFDYAGIASFEALEHIADSVQQLDKKGAHIYDECKHFLFRLATILAIRGRWKEQIEGLRRMRQWVLDAENILNLSWAALPTGDTPQTHDTIPGTSSKKQLKKQYKKNASTTNSEVAIRFDDWRGKLAQQLKQDTLTEKERECLEHFLRVIEHLRPDLIQCYDFPDFPRTNNETEGAIRNMKTRYRRISGRKNTNSYILRYGRFVAFYPWWGKDQKRWQQLRTLMRQVDHLRWPLLRKLTQRTRHRQVKRFRLHHHIEKHLLSREERWAASTEAAALESALETPSLH